MMYDKLMKSLRINDDVLASELINKLNYEDFNNLIDEMNKTIDDYVLINKALDLRKKLSSNIRNAGIIQ